MKSTTDALVEALESCSTGGYTDIDGDFHKTWWFDEKLVAAALALARAEQAEPQKVYLISCRVIDAHLGPMGATILEVWRMTNGALRTYEISNGGQVIRDFLPDDLKAGEVSFNQDGVISEVPQPAQAVEPLAKQKLRKNI